MNVEWRELFTPTVPPLEMVVRGTVVYLAIFFLLRFTFKRETGATSITNLLVLVLLADAAQNAMAGEYRSVSDGLILVATIVFWSIAMDFAAYYWPWARRLIHPRPLLLYDHGRILHHNLRRELLTVEELEYELRLRGVHSLQEVETVYMEPNGQISVVPKEQANAVDAPERQVP
ncbi:DUF421 domain-containing protein [Carbonactinospora thermoautotrophica]|uniref:DUF421 domain-containing protein n=1 Tax=Carbonactinospora thermoautotrophica TaxID=1469144 RepID=UPI003DA81795